MNDEENTYNTTSRQQITHLNDLMPDVEDKNVSGVGSLLEKIQEGKKMFTESGVKKSGYNNFQKYHYYELKDIVPAVINICDLLRISTKFEFDENVATLTVFDLDTGFSLDYHCPLPHVYGEDTKKVMQDIGACQTYARRYLYLAMLDITEADLFDKGSPSSESKNEGKNVSKSTPSKPKPKSKAKAKKKVEEVKPVEDNVVKSSPYDGVRGGSLMKSEGFVLGKRFSDAVRGCGDKPTTSRIKNYAMNQYQQQEISQSEYDNVIYVLEQLPEVVE